MVNKKNASIYPNITVAELTEEKKTREDERFIKQTLLHSPIFINIIPDFQVAVNKPFRGVASTSLNDEGDQFIWPKEEDSQIGVFSDDDDIFFDIGDTHLDGVNREIQTNREEDLELKSIKVIVKLQSLLVDDVEYHLNSAVRSSCIVKGSRNDEEQQEDSLFISLKSGFLLLIRLFYLPRDPRKTHIGNIGMIGIENGVFKPYIMQWWDAGSNIPAPLLETSGYQTLSHSSGLSCVATSASDVFRIYTTKNSKQGLVFNPHYNVPVSGLILHACFGESLEDNLMNNHILFLALIFTHQKRLELTLFEWTADGSLTHNLRQSILPLNNTFKIPVFIIPMRNGNFLLVSEEELTVITVHNIISASYVFRKAGFAGGFPTSYYKPNSRIRHFESKKVIDEILISTNAGVVYSIIVTDEEISIKPVVRISDPISVFSMEKQLLGYTFIFGSDSGSNRELIIEDIFNEDSIELLSNHQKLEYSNGHLVQDYKNWSPLLDFKVLDSQIESIDSTHSESEMWGLSGGGKRTRLSHFKTGYKARKLTRGTERLRRATDVFSFKCHGRSYIICSLPFASVSLEYMEDVNDFAESTFSNIAYDEPTIYAKNLINSENNLVLQVTPQRFIITDMKDYVTVSETETSNIILCDANSNLLALIVENRQQSKPVMEVKLYHLHSEIDTGFILNNAKDKEFISLKKVINVSYQPSMMKIISMFNKSLLVIGNYDGILEFYDCSDDKMALINSQSLHEILSSHEEYSQGSIIPNDIELAYDEIFLGTREGYLFRLKAQSNLSLSLRHFTNLGESPLRFIQGGDDKKILLIHCKNLWLINFDDCYFPYRVHFEEKNERTIQSLVPIQLTSEMEVEKSNLPFAFIREDGFTVGDINTFKSSVVKQTNIGGPAKTFTFVSFISAFLVFCVSKSKSTTMKFMDKKSLKSILHKESKVKTPECSIFGENEVAKCSCIWSVKRQDRISKKLLIGTSIQESRGSFKVLDVTRMVSAEDGAPSLKVLELTSFDHKQPITNIQQMRSNILFSSGRSIFATSYDSEERKLKPASNLITLPSDITDILVQKDNMLLVTTKLDSIFQFSYIDGTSLQDTEMLQLLSYDPSCKSLVNQAIISDKVIAGEKLQYGIQVMESKSKNMISQLSFRLSCISRVFNLKVKNRASTKSLETDLNHSVVSAGINGEIVILRLSYDTSPEVSSLRDAINTSKSFQYSPESFLSKLEAPFTEKLNGKGLIPVNNPYLDYKENKSNRAIMIDYDIDEFARYCNSYYITQ